MDEPKIHDYATKMVKFHFKYVTINKLAEKLWNYLDTFGMTQHSE